MDSSPKKAALWLAMLFWPYSLHASPPPVIYTDPIVTNETTEDLEGTTSLERKDLAIIEQASPSPSLWFQGLSGVSVRRNANPGQQARLSIRGSDGQQSLVLLDGVPMGGLLGGGADLSLLPNLGIERISIQRGGLSAKAGSDAMGGIVSLRTAALTRSPKAAASLRLGSLGTSGVDLNILGGSERVRASLSGSIFTSRGDFSFQDDAGRARTRENSDVRRRQLSLSLESGRERSPDWTFSHHMVEFDRGIAGVSEFPSPEARQSGLHLVSALHRKKSGSGSLRWSAHLAHRMERSHFVDPAPAFGPAIEQRAIMHAIYGAGTLQWSPGREHLVELNLDTSAHLGTVENLGAPEVDLREQRYAVALRDSWYRGSVVVDASVRVESWSKAELAWAPRLGVRWDLMDAPGRSFNLRMGLGRAYRVPSLSERWLNQGSIRGNPDILPEVGWSTDLQLEWTQNRVTIQLTPFASWYERTILFLPQSLYVIQAENAKDARVLGLEASAQFTVPGRQLVRLNYTFSDASFLDTADAMPGRPTHSGGVTWSGSWPTFGYSLSANGRSSIYLDRFESVREEASWTLDCAVYARMGEITLVVRGQNLLDVIDSVDHLQQPLPGRTVFAMLRWEHGAPK